MMRLHMRAWPPLLLLPLLAAPALRAAETHGRLSGVVLDGASQLPLGEVTVTARSATLPGEQAATTDTRGAFEMTFLPAGVYGLTIQHAGHEPFSATGVPVRNGKQVIVRITLMQEKAPPPPPPPAPPAAETAVPFAEGMTEPELISGPSIEYTPEAIEHEVEGTMQVRCVITAAGGVRNCKVLKGLPFMDRAVERALLGRRYKPATQGGKPLDVLYTFPIIKLTLNQ
jgi:TonB family protein